MSRRLLLIQSPTSKLILAGVNVVDWKNQHGSWKTHLQILTITTVSCHEIITQDKHSPTKKTAPCKRQANKFVTNCTRKDFAKFHVALGSRKHSTTRCIHFQQRVLPEVYKATWLPTLQNLSQVTMRLHLCRFTSMRTIN